MRGVLFCDVDGVLADFMGAARSQLSAMYPDVKVPDVWPLGYSDPAPFTRDQWQHFLSTTHLPSWWLRMPPLQENVSWLLTFLRFGPGVMFDTYYVTARSGPGVTLQTQMWLDGLGLRTFATNVLRVASGADKARAALLLTPDAMIDDDVDALAEVSHAFDRVPTLTKPKLYLVAAPYNEAEYARSDARQYITAVRGVENVVQAINDELASAAQESQTK